MRDIGAVKRAQRLIVAAFVVADILLAAAVGARFFVRLDLSRNWMYTLSAASKKIVAGLPEQLSLAYYVSDKLRSRYPFPAQVEDLLNEYAAYARGKVNLTIVDPATAKKPVSPEQLGIAAQQMQIVERQDINLATVYSGISLRYLDRVDALPFVSDLTTLEYDLSSKIRALVTDTRKVLGILLGDARKNLDQDYSALQQELSRQFQVRQVDKGKDVPADITVLFVIGGRDIGEADMLPVDQFVMRGGKALFAVSSVDIDLAAGLTAVVSEQKPLREALARYGALLKDELVLDTLCQRLSFQVQQNRYMVVQYPLWVTIAADAVARDNPVTARFAGLDLYWPCALEIAGVEGVKAEALVSSSPGSWTMKAPFEINPALSSMLVQQAGEKSRRPLALSLSGSFTSSFAARAAPAKTPLLLKSPETRLIVVADADFTSNMIQYTQAQYNMTFLSNCAEWLAQEDDLLSIKTRAQVDTRLMRIQDPARKAAAMGASQAINVAVVPLLVVVAGIARLLIRRRRKREPSREVK